MPANLVAFVVRSCGLVPRLMMLSLTSRHTCPVIMTKNRNTRPIKESGSPNEDQEIPMIKIQNQFFLCQIVQHPANPQMKGAEIITHVKASSNPITNDFYGCQRFKSNHFAKTQNDFQMGLEK